MRRLIYAFLLLIATGVAQAQRPTDKLDRGLVAVPSRTSGNYVGWRIFGEEYYDTRYNLYRDGTLIASNLKTSNYNDNSGKANSTYQVAAVVRGIEQEKCASVARWATQGKEFSVKPVYARGGTDVTQSHNYTINDISLGDVNGDGISEFVVKRLNGLDYTNLDNDSCFNFIECYNINGDRLWYIDIGPNMASGSNVETNAVLYDWDMDGKCEVIMRGADNMIIYTASGEKINIGNMKADTRWNGMEYTTTGAEYLLYINGETGEPYAIGPNGQKWMDYPLPRYDAGESQNEGAIWGNGIQGHRPTKHFFGAPFLDGRKASIFLGRGIYTREKMIALDVDPETHKLTERWRWKCYDSSSPWFGNGYHNYIIADVDWDGRDEIIYGSMVIDDNGKGLSTTGLGHGDAQHCSDLDPYRHGQELFACNESRPAMNYRNATTSQIYYRLQSSGDDGRALCGNFTNDYPGAVGRSTQSAMISCTADKPITELGNFIDWTNLNFRIYWDGDLLEEILNSPGTERAARIYKQGPNSGNGGIWTSPKGNMCNWTKNTPSAMGDIIGDWREELVLRADGDTKIVIYTTDFPTEFRNYTLWHDHQYRQGMVWEMCGYNQPPHTSYYLGEMEGITVAPPPLTMTGRVEIANGGTISSANADQHVLVCETGNTNISVSDGANPYIATFNVPSWVQGNDDNNRIVYEYYTCNVTGGAFSGDMRLVKQGDGTLNLPAVEQKYTGNTDIWAGKVNFDGKLLNSRLWLNRFAELNSNGGQFRSIHADYAAIVRPGGEANIGEITTDTLMLGFGSRLKFDVRCAGETLSSDKITTKYLKIEKKNWKYGPAYLTPVIEIAIDTDKPDGKLAKGDYLLMNIGELVGELDNIVVEGVKSNQRNTLELDDKGNLYLRVEDVREPGFIVWYGTENNIWNNAIDENFGIGADLSDKTVFVAGDSVTFDDSSAKKNINISGEVNPKCVIVDNTSAYTFSGTGKITGDAVFNKYGSGIVTMSNENTYTGGNHLYGGTVRVSSLANTTQTYGGLGVANTAANKFTMENGAVLQTTADIQCASAMQMRGDEGGVINNGFGLTMNRIISGTKLTKKGSGTLTLNVACSSLNNLVIAGGTVYTLGHSVPAKAVEFQGGTLSEGSEGGSSFAITVPAGKNGTLNMVQRGKYTNTLKGEGTMTFYIPALSGYEGTPRTSLAGNWSAFTGTVKANTYSEKVAFTFDNSYGLPKATLEIQSGRVVRNTSGKTFAIGKVVGNTSSLGGVCIFSQGAASGSVTWKIGNDENWSWGGTFIEACNVIKTGSGKVTLSGASTNTGTFRVDEGQLHISNKATLGTGTLTVAKDAILSGATGVGSSLNNSSVTINGHLLVGTTSSSTSGGIDFGNHNVTFNAGSVYEFTARKCATATSAGCASISGIKQLTMKGTIKVNISESNTLQKGDSIRIWEATTYSSLSAPKFEFPDGVTFDTSRINEGLLFVLEISTDINDINADEEVTTSVYTTDGMLVDTYTCRRAEIEASLKSSAVAKGVYILKVNTSKGVATIKMRK